MSLTLRFVVVLLSFGFASSSGTLAHAQSDLARAYRVIASKKFVDLTHSFGPDTPVWSGFGQAKFTPATDPKTHKPYTIKDDGFRTTFYEIVGQYGTHVDPPAHFDEKGITLDEIPLKQMILPLIVLDDTPYLAKDQNHAFSLTDLYAWEKKHGRVPRGSFVALRTDMYKDWNSNPERFKRAPFPAWAFETIKFLYEQRGVVAKVRDRGLRIGEGHGRDALGLEDLLKHAAECRFVVDVDDRLHGNLGRMMRNRVCGASWSSVSVPR